MVTQGSVDTADVSGETLLLSSLMPPLSTMPSLRNNDIDSDSDSNNVDVLSTSNKKQFPKTALVLRISVWPI